MAKLSSEGIDDGKDAWYISHHVISHNNKDGIVFDFTFQGQCLNKCPLPGPILGPTVLGVLLCFRQRSAALSLHSYSVTDLILSAACTPLI